MRNPSPFSTIFAVISDRLLLHAPVKDYAAFLIKAFQIPVTIVLGLVTRVILLIPGFDTSE